MLKPAYYAPNGYRFYEEPQLLMLQQILFYRELGFELKQVEQILGRADFEKVAALESHRQMLQESRTRIGALLDTIEKTIGHLKGTAPMNNADMFTGFSVGAGKDRFDEPARLRGEPNDCKVSTRDTGGAACVFESAGTICWPLHRHHDQDEWLYVLGIEGLAR